VAYQQALLKAAHLNTFQTAEFCVFELREGARDPLARHCLILWVPLDQNHQFLSRNRNPVDANKTRYYTALPSTKVRWARNRAPSSLLRSRLFVADHLHRHVSTCPFALKALSCGCTAHYLVERAAAAAAAAAAAVAAIPPLHLAITRWKLPVIADAVAAASSSTSSRLRSFFASARCAMRGACSAEGRRA
jgi:hypothetical protein